MTFEETYEEIALNCFRFLGFKSFSEVDNLTIPQYELMMKAAQLRQVDLDYRNHLQAYLNFAVKAEKKAGKNKTKPVFSRFEKFFDYKKAVAKIKGENSENSRFSGVGKLLNKGE